MIKEDVMEIKRQVEQWGIKPTKILMDQKTWEAIVNFPLIQLYRMILEEGFRVIKQIEHEVGFEFWLKHPCNPNTIRIILKYPDA